MYTAEVAHCHFVHRLDVLVPVGSGLVWRRFCLLSKTQPHQQTCLLDRSTSSDTIGVPPARTTHIHVCECRGSSPTRGSSLFLGKVTALGELCCFALLTLLASFFLHSHLPLKHVHVCKEVPIVSILWNSFSIVQ